VVEAGLPGQLETPACSGRWPRKRLSGRQPMSGKSRRLRRHPGLKRPGQRQAVEPPRKEVAPAPAGVERSPRLLLKERAGRAGLPLAQRQAVEPPPAPAPRPGEKRRAPGGGRTAAACY